MKKSWLALPLALALALPVAADGVDTPPATLEETLSQVAALSAQYGAANSLEYAVWQDGEILYSGHMGDSLTADHSQALYGIGSVSKMYITVSIMQLVEDGKIDLETPVVDYLPQFTMADDRYVDITVGMLLDHSSGLMGSTLASAFQLGVLDTSASDNLLDTLATQKLKADPGAFSVYCNDGFTLAQLVLEAVTGQSFESYLQENIFTPLGLEDSFSPGDDFDLDRMARFALPTAVATAVTTPGTEHYSMYQPFAQPELVGVLATGGIISDADDLATFGGALTSPGLLTQDSLDAMTAPAYADGLWPEDAESILAYGLGWDAVEVYPLTYTDIAAQTKGGDTITYHANLLVVPDHDLAIGIVSTGGVSLYHQMAGTQMAVAILAEEGVEVDTTPRALPQAEHGEMPPEMMAYSGVYADSTTALTVEITEGGTLHLADQTIAYYEDGTFRDIANSAALSFETIDGQVYLRQAGYQELPWLGQLGMDFFVMMQLPENPVTPEVQAAWDARNGLYYVVNMSASDIIPAAMLPTLPILTDGELQPGYMSFNSFQRLVDENLAEGVAVIPGTGGRDWQTVSTYTQDGVEYLTTGGNVAIPSSAISPVYNGAAYATIGEESHARWFTTGEAAGKTMHVTLPQGGAFYVYDSLGLPVAGSWAWGDTSAVLPIDGHIAFLGESGMQFFLTMDE